MAENTTNVGSWQQVYESTSTERVKRLRNRVFQRPEICIEKARAEIKAYELYKDEPRVIQRARNFETYLNDKTVTIFDDELIVGAVTSKYRGSQLSGELQARWISAELDDPEKDFAIRPKDPHVISDEDRQELREVILPYWKDSNFQDYCFERLAQVPGLNERALLDGRCDHTPMVALIMSEKDLAHMSPYYEKVLSIGINGIKAEAERYLKEMDLPYQYVRVPERKDFYRACIISLNAVLNLAERYVEKAKEMAAVENNPQRKKELLKIAEVLTRVPAEPPRDWYEALQSLWFVYMCVINENANICNGIGRFDQYMYPFYKKTVLEDKTMSADAARELLECFMVKAGGFSVLFSYDTVKCQAGYSTSVAMSLGGQKRDGTDACNELTEMVLLADQNIMLAGPDIGFFLNKDTSPEMLKKVAYATRLGTGKPKLYNTDVFIKQCHPEFPDLSVEDLREGLGLLGCSEGVMYGVTQHNGFGSLLCMSTVLEITLNSGRCPHCGELVGLETGDPRDFKSIDELIAAFQKQVTYFAVTCCEVMREIFNCQGERMHLPFCSSLTEGTFQAGKDLAEGGAPYTFWGIMYGSSVDVGDSLHVIDELIYEKKMVTWDEMLQALKDNWEGHEELRELCLHGVDKYGNDDDHADKYVQDVMNFTCDCTDYLRTRADLLPRYGGEIENVYTAVTLNVNFGAMTGALPNGHLAGTPCVDTISPMQGTDKKGPVAALNSAAKMPHLRMPMGTPFNQKLMPQMLATEKDMDRYVDYIRTFIDAGLEMIQINIVSADLLRDAMKHPEKYPGLMVRVASYLAFFTELDPVSQQDIIDRTEQYAW